MGCARKSYYEDEPVLFDNTVPQGFEEDTLEVFLTSLSEHSSLPLAREIVKELRYLRRVY